VPVAAAAPGEPIVSRLVHHPRLRRVVVRFGEQLAEKLAAMDAAWSQLDLRALADLAHWLKGSGGTVGYDAFYEPARALEEQAKSGAEAAIAELLGTIHAMAARLHVPDEPAVANDAPTSALRSA
jgi:HPt (histidine-containing phosphotransfer) domain-containing protein